MSAPGSTIARAPTDVSRTYSQAWTDLERIDAHNDSHVNVICGGFAPKCRTGAFYGDRCAWNRERLCLTILRRRRIIGPPRLRRAPRGHARPRPQRRRAQLRAIG